MSAETTRTFVGVFPPREVVDALDAAVAPVRGVRDGVQWVAAANLHMTLRFLGDLSAPELEAARQAVLAAASGAGVAPFAVTTGAPGAFPGPARPRVLWIGARSGAPELVALAARVEKALVRERFALAEKPFTPHLTMGRVRADAPPALAAARFLGLSLPSLSFEVGAITLVASQLGPGGARYSPLLEAKLG